MDKTSADELLTRTLDLLDNVDLPGYYGPPNALDEVIAELLQALAAAPRVTWDRLVQALTDQRRHVLARFSLRSTMLALRTRDDAYLRAGLLAHCAIQPPVSDWREDMIHFAPTVHVARELGMDVTELFDTAALHARPDLADVMRTYGRRTDVSLGVFGWRQVETPDGPTFETVNWRSGPSGAVVGEPSWDAVNWAQAQKLLEWVRRQREAERRTPRA